MKPYLLKLVFGMGLLLVWEIADAAQVPRFGGRPEPQRFERQRQNVPEIPPAITNVDPLPLFPGADIQIKGTNLMRVATVELNSVENPQRRYLLKVLTRFRLASEERLTARLPWSIPVGSYRISLKTVAGSRSGERQIEIPPLPPDPLLAMPGARALPVWRIGSEREQGEYELIGPETPFDGCSAGFFRKINGLNFIHGDKPFSLELWFKAGWSPIPQPAPDDRLFPFAAMLAKDSGPGTQLANVTGRDLWAYEQWHHLVAVVHPPAGQERGSVEIFGDGRRLTTSPQQEVVFQGFPKGLLGLAVGASPLENLFFKGWLQKVRVHSLALTEDEVRQLFHSGRMVTLPECVQPECEIEARRGTKSIAGYGILLPHACGASTEARLLTQQHDRETARSMVARVLQQKENALSQFVLERTQWMRGNPTDLLKRASARFQLVQGRGPSIADQFSAAWWNAVLQEMFGVEDLQQRMQRKYGYWKVALLSSRASVSNYRYGDWEDLPLLRKQAEGLLHLSLELWGTAKAIFAEAQRNLRTLGEEITPSHIVKNISWAKEEAFVFAAPLRFLNEGEGQMIEMMKNVVVKKHLLNKEMERLSTKAKSERIADADLSELSYRLSSLVFPTYIVRAPGVAFDQEAYSRLNDVAKLRRLHYERSFLQSRLAQMHTERQQCGFFNAPCRRNYQTLIDKLQNELGAPGRPGTIIDSLWQLEDKIVWEQPCYFAGLVVGCENPPR